jgi:hypothetical protein
MKTDRRPGAGLILIVLLVALHPVSAIAGSKTYDLNILLDEPHLFSQTVATAPPTAPPTARSKAPAPSSSSWWGGSVAQPAYGPIPQPGAEQNAGGNAGGTYRQLSEKREAPAHSALYAVSLFGGVMTDNRWEEVFIPGEVDFRDTGLVAIALSRKIWDYKDKLSIEIEGQVVRYFGDQENWEFNLPIVFRWHAFPWDKWVETSFAFGIGPSYASEVPVEEIAREGSSEQLLVHWFAELEFGPPASLWSGILRLHHRSEAYGLVADEGGSNSLTAGIKRRF